MIMYGYQGCIGFGLQLHYHAVCHMDWVKYSFSKERKGNEKSLQVVGFKSFLFSSLLPLLNFCVFFTFVIFTDKDCWLIVQAFWHILKNISFLSYCGTSGINFLKQMEGRGSLCLLWFQIVPFFWPKPYTFCSLKTDGKTKPKNDNKLLFS